MKNMKHVLSMILLSSLLSTVAAQDSLPVAQESLKKLVEKKKSAGVTGGYATADEILWIGYEGHADVEAQKPVDASTLFRTASIAKPITAVAIMQLHEQGKLDLDKPISEYLPNFPIEEGGAITVRHLLQHSSGIGAYKSSKEFDIQTEYPTLLDAIGVFGDRKLRIAPGSGFFYTSYGYVVLGWVIEEITGITYEAYVQENIFDKIGMNNTGVEKFLQPLENQTELYKMKYTKPKKFRSDKNCVIPAERTNLSNRVPGGGFYSTAEDLLKFGQAILKNELVSQESLDLMWTDSGLKKEGNPYGMGWFLYGEHPEYGNVYGHGGSQTGASNQFMIYPDEGLVTVMMSNTSDVWGYVFGMVLNFPIDARK